MMSVAFFRLSHQEPLRPCARVRRWFAPILRYGPYGNVGCDKTEGVDSVEISVFFVVNDEPSNIQHEARYLQTNYPPDMDLRWTRLLQCTQCN